MTTLTELQVEVLKAAKNKPGFAFYMDMGLGKSLTALSEFVNLVNDNKKATRMVVISPNSFKSGWAAEISKHRMNFAVHVYSASKHKAAEDFAAGRFSMPAVLIVNYDALRLAKTQALLDDFTNQRNCYLVIDESISIKNPTAKRTKAVLKFAPYFSFVRLLSGKPTTQGPADLWAQLKVIGVVNPGENYYAFRNTYCVMGGYENREVRGIKNAEGLKRRMNGSVFVAKKRDWLKTLPEKSYTTREYTLSGRAAVEYDRMEREFLAYVESKKGEIKSVEASIALAKFTKLMQLHCGFIHDEEGEPEWIVSNNDNPRLQTLLATLDETEGKVCITYKHRFVGEQLWKKMVERGLHPARITGGMKPHAIEEEKRLFNNEPTCRVMLLQLDASRYGHTLIGDQTKPEDACYTMLFYQNDYSLDTRSQIEDRIHRIGQKNAALYVDFVGSSMDARMIEALQFKTRLYEALFGRP